MTFSPKLSGFGPIQVSLYAPFALTVAECIVQPVRYVISEHIRSHFGILKIEGVKVEIMGALQKRLDGQRWESPVEVAEHSSRVKQNPVLSSLKNSMKMRPPISILRFISLGEPFLLRSTQWAWVD